MEAIIHHFKIYSSGFSIPSNETYVSTEAPKGEFLRRGQHIWYTCLLIDLKVFLLAKQNV